MKPRYSCTTKPCMKPHQEIGAVLFRNFKLREVKDESYNCTSRTPIHPRITHPHYYEPNEPTSPVGRWCRPQPVLVPLDDQQTYLKIEQRFQTENSELNTRDKFRNIYFSCLKNGIVSPYDRHNCIVQHERKGLRLQ